MLPNILRKAAAASFFALVVAAPAVAEDLALVISNPSTLTGEQRNVITEGHDELVALYRSRGYRTLEGLDLDREAMAGLIARFETRVDQADRLIVHYSGRTVSVGDTTALVPASAEVSTRTDALFNTVPLSLLLDIAGTRPGQSVLALGTPKQPPEGAEGFANEELEYDIPVGVLVVRGAPDHVIRVLADQMIRRGRSASEIDAEEARVTFEGLVQPGLVLAEPRRARRDDDSGDDGSDDRRPNTTSEEDLDFAEEAMWILADRSGNDAVLRAYLARFPEGRYASEARRRLGWPDPDPAPDADGDDDRDGGRADPGAREAALNLRAADRREIQEDLTVLGYNTRGIDGIFGPGTRSAIGDWQEKEGYRATGFLTERQVRELRQGAAARAAEIERRREERRQERIRADNEYWSQTGADGGERGLRAYLQRYPNGEHSDQAKRRLAALEEQAEREAAREERDAWQSARDEDTPRAYRAYLDRYPDGRFADRARARVQALREASLSQGRAAQYREQEQALGLNVASAAVLEQRLQVLGYDTGPADGTFDRKTRTAIAEFQRREDLRATGYLNAATVQRLIIATSG